MKKGIDKGDLKDYLVYVALIMDSEPKNEGMRMAKVELSKVIMELLVGLDQEIYSELAAENYLNKNFKKRDNSWKLGGNLSIGLFDKELTLFVLETRTHLTRGLELIEMEMPYILRTWKVG